VGRGGQLRRLRQLLCALVESTFASFPKRGGQPKTCIFVCDLVDDWTGARTVQQLLALSSLHAEMAAPEEWNSFVQAVDRCYVSPLGQSFELRFVVGRTVWSPRTHLEYSASISRARLYATDVATPHEAVVKRCSGQCVVADACANGAVERLTETAGSATTRVATGSGIDRSLSDPVKTKLAIHRLYEVVDSNRRAAKKKRSRLRHSYNPVAARSDADKQQHTDEPAVARSDAEVNVQPEPHLPKPSRHCEPVFTMFKRNTCTTPKTVRTLLDGVFVNPGLRT
jgi:hypothetical protein